MNPYRQVIGKMGLNDDAQGPENVFSWLYVLLSVLAEDFDENPHERTFENPMKEVVHRLQKHGDTHALRQAIRYLK